MSGRGVGEGAGRSLYRACVTHDKLANSQSHTVLELRGTPANTLLSLSRFRRKLSVASLCKPICLTMSHGGIQAAASIISFMEVNGLIRKVAKFLHKGHSQETFSRTRFAKNLMKAMAKTMHMSKSRLFTASIIYAGKRKKRAKRERRESLSRKVY